VFLFLPAFGLGIVLGLLTVRSRSLVPAMLFHFLYNGLLLAATYFSHDALPENLENSWPFVVGICLVTAIVLLWWLYRKPYAVLAQSRQLH
jgi:lysylphosphatidylglycerol synthetase-like protein (DUF2156 family)